MNLQYFPMDRQMCSIEIESCELARVFSDLDPFDCFLLIHNFPPFFPVGFGMTEIIYQWQQKGNAVQVAKDVELPQFRVLGYRKKTRIEELTTGK